MLNTYVALVGRFQVVRCQGNKLNKNEAQGTILAEVVPPHCQWANAPRYVNECTHTHTL